MKTIKIQASFEVLDPNTSEQEGKQTISDSEDLDCVTTLHPIKLAASTPNIPINLGGVGLAKRIYIKTDHEVTIKFNATTEAGFNLGPGEMILMNDSGITALFASTGVNAPTMTVVAAGDA